MYGQQTIDKIRCGIPVGAICKPAPKVVGMSDEEGKTMKCHENRRLRENWIIDVFEECQQIHGGCQGCVGLTIISKHQYNGPDESVCDAYLGDPRVCRMTPAGVREMLRELRWSEVNIACNDWIVLLRRWVHHGPRLAHIAYTRTETWCGTPIIGPASIWTGPTDDHPVCKECVGRRKSAMANPMRELVEE